MKTPTEDGNLDDDDEKGVASTDTLGGDQKALVVTIEARLVYESEPVRTSGGVSSADTGLFVLV